MNFPLKHVTTHFSSKMIVTLVLFVLFHDAQSRMVVSMVHGKFDDFIFNNMFALNKCNVCYARKGTQ